MWGTFILVFASVWLLQIVLTFFQSKHYQHTLKEMSNRSSGYLGVGVTKHKFGIGTVVILVADLSGIIIDAKEMRGVTVFSRFKPMHDLIGLSINTCLNFKNPADRKKAINMAVHKIEEQMHKNQMTG